MITELLHLPNSEAVEFAFDSIIYWGLDYLMLDDLLTYEAQEQI